VPVLTRAVCEHSTVSTQRNADQILVTTAAFQIAEMGATRDISTTLERRGLCATRYTRLHPKVEVSSPVTVQHAAL
jgi:hypothetical protein